MASDVPKGATLGVVRVAFKLEIIGECVMPQGASDEELRQGIMSQVSMTTLFASNVRQVRVARNAIVGVQT